mmetsp:Transcript_56778/g.93405  ORF Transcript_56778/g.93405 Transcript_56778/m.93405 type:complete len:211 (-) Transcript_56778:788-1420(-)
MHKKNATIQIVLLPIFFPFYGSPCPPSADVVKPSDPQYNMHSQLFRASSRCHVFAPGHHSDQGHDLYMPPAPLWGEGFPALCVCVCVCLCAFRSSGCLSMNNWWTMQRDSRACAEFCTSIPFQLTSRACMVLWHLFLQRIFSHYCAHISMPLGYRTLCRFLFFFRRFLLTPSHPQASVAAMSLRGQIHFFPLSSLPCGLLLHVHFFATLF